MSVIDDYECVEKEKFVWQTTTNRFVSDGMDYFVRATT